MLSGHLVFVLSNINKMTSLPLPLSPRAKPPPLNLPLSTSLLIVHPSLPVSNYPYLPVLLYPVSISLYILSMPLCLSVCLSPTPLKPPLFSSVPPPSIHRGQIHGYKYTFTHTHTHTYTGIPTPTNRHMHLKKV